MLKDTPNPDEEAEAKLGQGGESEDEKEFNALFDGINLDDDNADIEALRKQVEDVKKGAAKFFSEKGMKKAQEEKDVKQDTTIISPTKNEVVESDLEVLFFESKPEADLVKDDLKQVAKAKGLTIIQAWKSESWLQNKAKALHSEKIETEENRGRIGDPSSGISVGKDAETKARENSFISNLPPGFSANTPKL